MPRFFFIRIAFFLHASPRVSRGRKIDTQPTPTHLEGAKEKQNKDKNKSMIKGGRDANKLSFLH